MVSWSRRVFVTVLTLAMVGALSTGSAVAKPVKVNHKEASAKIDRILAAYHAQHELRPNKLMNDSQFVRRMYLEITGTIPTAKQAKAFLNSKEPAKRQALIDELMASPGYVSHQFNFWADLLRIRSRLNNNVSGIPYVNFVKDAIRHNMPYDEFVTEMITAEGRIFDNGAAGYFLRDTGMPLDNTSNTARVFLGTELSCAQCHDHPFDKWSQYEFYELAAFTAGTNTRSSNQRTRDLYKLMEKEGLDADQKQSIRRMIRPYGYEVADTNRPLRLPKDYKYSDAKPQEVVEAATIMGAFKQVEKGEKHREVYAAWMTSKDNPRFAKTIANRLWKKAMGVGLFEPVDEITDQTEATVPELMDYLEQLVKDLDFDLKAYQRILYSSKIYQRQATRKEVRLDQVYHFQGPKLRRISAEQMWDSYLTLAMPNPDNRVNPRVSGYAMLNLDDFTDQELIGMAKKSRMSGTLPTGMMKEMGYVQPDKPQHAKFPADMVRAAEMSLPAPAGHFLRQFGQSDKEMIDAYSRDPSVTQVLTLLNGPMYNVLMYNPQSVMRKNLADAKEPGKQVELLFMSILSRQPTKAERSLALREFRESKQKAPGNLIWALLNTREYMFIQ
jgi:hypothetical protein